VSVSRVTALLALGLVLSIAAALCLGAVRYTPLELVTEGLRSLGLTAAPAIRIGSCLMSQRTAM